MRSKSVLAMSVAVAMTTIALVGSPLEPAFWVVAGPLGVWAGNGYTGDVQRVDETTNTAGRVVHVGPDLAQMIELDGSLWVASGEGDRLRQITDSAVSRTVELGGRTFALASDGAALWLGTDSDRALRVDPRDGAVTSVALAPGTDAVVLAADPRTGSVWVASSSPTPRLIRVR